MSEEIKLENCPAKPVFEVAAEPFFWKIPFALANGFSQADAAIEAAGARKVDMPYARYLEVDWSRVKNGFFRQMLDLLFSKQKMMIGLHLAEGKGANGEQFGTEIPAGRYVTTIHRGAYHKVGETYSRIVDWAAEQGIALQDNSIEHYIDDPTEVAKAEVRTEVFVPVAE